MSKPQQKFKNTAEKVAKVASMEKGKDEERERKEKGEEEERIADILKKDEKGFFQKHFYLIGDVWNFLRVRKKWWLLPIIVTLALVGALVLFGQATPLSPFIYALF